MTPDRRKAIHEAMVRFAEGDRSAIDVLVAELWPVLLNFAHRGLPSEHDAEDVAQEVFVRICSRIVEFDRTRDALSWAFGIASYEVMTLRRKHRRRRETTDQPLSTRVDAQPLADDVLMHEELLAALTQAVGALSADDQAMLGLAMMPASASEAQGATIRKRRQRALDRLRDVWRKHYG